MLRSVMFVCAVNLARSHAPIYRFLLPYLSACLYWCLNTAGIVSAVARPGSDMGLRQKGDYIQVR
jgi:hypothetical protein